MNRAKKTNRWEDHYARRARKEHFPARSVYKLKEIQSRFALINKGDRILDLGCAPGSWLLEAAELTGRRGQVVGIDLKPVTIKLPGHVTVHTLDLFELDEGLLAEAGKGFNVILSDMAPSTTGSKFADAARSYDLCRAALSLTDRLLVPGGAFICKIFQGEDFMSFVDSVKKKFAKHKIFKPQSSRKASKEIFIIAMQKR